MIMKNHDFDNDDENDFPDNNPVGGHRLQLSTGHKTGRVIHRVDMPAQEIVAQSHFRKSRMDSVLPPRSECQQSLSN